MKHLKEEFDKLTIKDVLVYMLATMLIVSAIVAVFLSLYIPPEGEVHESILIYYAISSASAGSLLGISMHFSNQLENFKSQITSMINSGLAPSNNNNK